MLGASVNSLLQDACAPWIAGQDGLLFPADFVASPSTPYNIHKAWKIGSGRFHHPADSGIAVLRR
jgi:hypothetical protein